MGLLGVGVVGVVWVCVLLSICEVFGAGVGGGGDGRWVSDVGLGCVGVEREAFA